MLINQIIELLNKLRLFAMITELGNQRINTAVQEWSFEERLGMPVQAEDNDREGRRFQRTLRAAKFKIQTCVEDVDYRSRRGLERSQFSSLTTCDWTKNSLNKLTD